MNINPFSIPSHVARAYGVGSTAPPRNVAPAPRATDATSVDHGATRVRLDRLVGATVPGGIEFTDAETARPTAPAERTASIPFYRRPAEQNAAATNLSANAALLGRSIDVRG